MIVRRSRLHRHWHIILSVPLAVLAAGILRYAILLPSWFAAFVAARPALRAPFLEVGTGGAVGLLAIAAIAGAGVLAAIAVLGLVRRPWALVAVRGGCAVGWALFLAYAYVVLRATGVLLLRNVGVDGVVPSPASLWMWRSNLLMPAAGAAAFLALLYLYSWRRTAISLYAGVEDPSPAPGDRILENLRTHGQDPKYRKSLIGSLTVHVLVIVIIPWLFSFWGCVNPYLVPKGSGTPQIAGVVKIIKAPAKKKKKKFILNQNSAISFHVPDLDESDVGKNVEEMTQLTYRADPNRVLAEGAGAGTGGKLGAGGGKGGGWPDGMDNALVRFIRLEYSGPGWDDGMDEVSRADINFLQDFQKVTGFKVAPRSESHPIGMLRKYRKGYAPPFVYMTGANDINVTAGDMRVLRDYLYGGGMLIADCGSPNFDYHFRNFIRNVLPGESLVVISDDDPLYQLPFPFPNGAPPLWHHGGMKAMGVKRDDRWIVFYHPGDMNDAWKTGHSGMDPQLAKASEQLGINLVYYAFTRYLELTRKYRK